MTIAYPLVLLGLIAVLALGVFALWRIQIKDRALRKLGDSALIQPLVASADRRLWWLKIFLRLGAIASMIVALSRPMWGLAEELVAAEGVAVMVVLDVSNSMSAMDTAPSRIERAKLTARTLFERDTVNYVGLILFAGDAFVQFPLTSDVQTALTFLDAASTQSISRQGTAVGDALDLALDTLDDRIASQSVIVLMTDGENHEGSPLEAAEHARARNVIIHVVGYGSPEGTTIPVLSEAGAVIGAKSDNTGNVVVTRLNELPLRQIADITDGLYRRASTNGIEIVDLLNAIQTVSDRQSDQHLQIRRVDRFGWFVLLGLLLLFVDVVITEKRL